MPRSPFRFLHASDFQLERPPFGLAEVPDHLAARLTDSPYRAAQRVFDVAIQQRVDFLALAGNLLDATLAGPAALVFLTEQFERLQSLGIAVYWAAGPADQLGDWAGVLKLPANVRLFTTADVARVVHQRNGEPVAQILARGADVRSRIGPADFRRDTAQDRVDLFSVAIAHGTVDTQTLAEPQAAPEPPIDYWALGGEHDRSTLLISPRVAHYCGSPQGRQPQEPGPHGCTLVQVDETAQVQMTFVPTDVVRWQREQITIGVTATLGELERTLSERIAALRGDETGPDLLAYWTVVGSGPLARQLRRSRLAGELVNRLRTEHGQKRPALWTVSLEGVSTPWSSPQPAAPTELYEQQTILGEFLRALRDYEADPTRPLVLEPYLSERHLAGSVADAVGLQTGGLQAVGLQDTGTRDRALREAAALGVELLGPEEPAL